MIAESLPNKYYYEIKDCPHCHDAEVFWSIMSISLNNFDKTVPVLRCWKCGNYIFYFGRKNVNWK